jgi:pantothenate kinase
MPDPVTAHARRGAEFTFDGQGFLALVQSLLPLPQDTVIYAPAFDHAVKDPVADSISILPSHKIVVFEGNYLLLDRDPWREAAKLLDERWFVEVDFAVAKKRLIARHVAAGIAKDEIEAERRAAENDLVNGEEIVRLRLPVDELVISLEQESWSHSH